LRADKRSVIRFFVVYFGSLAVLFVLIGGLYYQNEKERLERQKQDEMTEFAKSVENQLGELHFSKLLGKPISRKGYGLGLYDIDGEVVSSKDISAKPPLKKAFYKEGDDYYYVLALDRYFLGVAFVALKSAVPSMDGVFAAIFGVGFGALTFMGFVAVYLARLMIRPLVSAIESVDAFVKDSAHELATPIMTVSMALSALRAKADPSLETIVKRMEVGVKNLQIIYDELAMSGFYEFSKQMSESVDMAALAAERVEYFGALFEYKNITIHQKLTSAPLKIERAKAARVIDNILSNAIKYTKNGGNVYVEATNGFFGVRDDGYGIEESKLPIIFDRYARASTKAGGFGIGLATVKKICDEYSVKIEVKSEKNRGSEFVFKW